MKNEIEHQIQYWYKKLQTAADNRQEAIAKRRLDLLKTQLKSIINVDKKANNESLETLVKERRELLFLRDKMLFQDIQIDIDILNQKIKQLVGEVQVDDSIVYFSYLLNQKFKYYPNSRLILFDDGTKYSIDEVNYLWQGKLNSDAIKLIHQIKKDFSSKFIDVKSLQKIKTEKE